jgi:hypothetical protein
MPFLCVEEERKKNLFEQQRNEKEKGKIYSEELRREKVRSDGINKNSQ